MVVVVTHYGTITSDGEREGTRPTINLKSPALDRTGGNKPRPVGVLEGVSTPADIPFAEHELAAYADGTLEGGRRAIVEAALAESAELRSNLADQRRSLTAIRAANLETHAPMALRERLASAPREAPARRSWRPGWFAGMAAALAAIAVLAVFLLPSGAGGPTVAEAAAAAARPATQAAPGPGGDKLLDISVDAVAFPDYAGKFGWKATGSRTDEVDGRAVTTVTYAKGSQTVRYAIVAGDALDAPSEGTVTDVEGTPVRVLDSDGRRVATWQRKGQTCVLVAQGVDDATLRELAAWRGQGSVDF